MATFEKDGRTRKASTPAAAVELRFRGWRLVDDEASADEMQVQTVDGDVEPNNNGEDELPNDTTDAG